MIGDHKLGRGSLRMNVAVMFAFFNRVADAFGISPQGFLKMDAQDR